MKDGFIKVGAATPKIRVADVEFNGSSIIKEVNEAAKLGVKLLCFPELCITGYTCGDLFGQSALLDAARAQLYRIAEETKGLDVIFAVGLPMVKNGKLINAAAVVYRGEILGTVGKKNLPNYNEFYELRNFAEDNEPPVVFTCKNIPEFSFGVEICEDLWVAEPPSVKLARGGAAIILNLSASNEMIGKADYRRSLVSGQSGRLICGYVYASAGDGESTTDLVFSGHDLIAENGVVLKESKLFCNRLTVSEIDVKLLAAERRKNTSFKSYEDINRVEFDMPAAHTELTRYISPAPFVPSDKANREERCETILLMQSEGLKKRVEHTNARSLVIGISGGLDSSLALLVCVKTMDLLNRSRKDIIAVTMPCFGTTKRTKSNAVSLCEALGVTLRDIDITKSVLQHFADIGHDPENRSVVYENGQARARTYILMDIANEENGLVVGTGDLSELALGWATYNGDHISMYGVNGGVPKTLIRHIVRYYGDVSEDGVLKRVLYDILDTPVSPELLPAEKGEISQKTEDLVGPYQLHDFFLYYAIRRGYSPSKVYRLALYAMEGKYSEETVLKWLKNFYRRFFSQQFKRSCLPDSPKVGSVTLSPRGDWRMPSDACAALWLKEAEAL
ncbi:MAG: NAD(+) synthase [Firmicutes bacterium]|nr:NAD(+) synthase [[Eubacterium] siraeum]MCM1488726.1 NAD(+) synthase [Bacillota bacterium]